MLRKEDASGRFLVKPILALLPEGSNENRRFVPVVGRSSDLQAFKLFPTGRCFPVRDANQCVMTAVVPAYRCGTVPDSHRIPLTDNERRLARQWSGLQMQKWNPFVIQP